MEEQKTTNKLSWPDGIRGLFFLAIILAIFFSYEMGNRPFADPDEGRYVEIPREMVLTGDYVTPKLNGLKYFEKPALFYWMQSASIKAFGINETSMRLWPVIFAILGCLSVFFIGAKYYSKTVGLLSSGILATNILYYAHSRLIILDLVTSVLISATLWCFYVAFIKGSSRKKIWILGMYAISALACLTKGLIGVVLPTFVVFLWILFTNSWHKFKEILYFQGIVVFLVIFLPWHIIVALRNHDFLYFYFVVEHFLRYTTTMHCRYQPAWFFIPILIAGLLPWTGFSIIAIKSFFQKAVNKNSESIFLLSWIFGILGFFSFSNSKLIPYILPISQPIALITGISIVNSINSSDRNFRNGVLTNIVLFVVAFIAYFLMRSQLADILKNPDVILLLNVIIALLFLEAVILTICAYSKISKTSTILLFVFLSANMMWVINKAAVYYQKEKKPSTKYLASIIRLNKKNEDLVFCYKRYYQDFPVYLNSTVGVIDFVGELEFGASANKRNGKLITGENFWKLWHTTNKRIFLLLSRENYRNVFATKNSGHNILEFDKNFIVITNK